MAVEWICDGCGKRLKDPKAYDGFGNWVKPELWYQRSDDEGPQDACSRECIKLIAEKSGKTGLVLPL